MHSTKENDSSSRPMIVDSISFAGERDVKELKGANGNARRQNVARECARLAASSG